MFLFIIIGICLSQDMEDVRWKKKTPVYQLKDDNWDAVTRLGQQQFVKPWFIFFWAPWCKGCHRIIPIWEDLFRKYNHSIHFGAINTYDQTSIRDRLGIEIYPTFIFFNLDNKMYWFDGNTNMENFTDFIDNQRYLEKEGYDIPIEIDHFKKWMRRVFSVKMIPVYIIISFIVTLTTLCVYGNRQEKQTEQQTKLLKQEVIRRKLERDERECLLRKKLN